MPKPKIKKLIPVEQRPFQTSTIEAFVLGAMIADPEEAALIALSIIPDEGCFSNPKHQLIFRAYREAFAKGAVLDYVTLCDELWHRGEIDAAGGRDYITDLPLAIASPAYAEHWARLMMKDVQKERLRRMCLKVGYDSTMNAEVGQMIQDCSTEITQISGMIQGKQHELLGRLANDLLLSYQEAKDEGGLTGLSSGLDNLDRITAGWQKGDTIVVAGRPSVGKTGFALCCASNAAQKGAKILIFSLEMSSASLAARIMSAACNYDTQKFRCGRLTKAEFQNLVQRSQAIMSQCILIDDNAAIDTTQIHTRAAQVHKNFGLDLIVIDHIGLVEIPGTAENQNQKISEISRACKRLAKELRLPVMVISQLSRALEHREDKRPILADLRDSGSIEQDADVVLMLHRPGRYDEKEEKGKIEVIVRKQRNGPADMTVNMHFNLKTGKFLPLSKSENAGGAF